MSCNPTSSEWSDTVRKRMAQANRRGVPTGPVPLGYAKARRNGRTLVETDGETAPLVREAFRLAGLKKASLGSIVLALSARGLVSKRGTPLSATALWRILTNPFYCGIVRYAGETAEGAHEPLVAEAEFRLVQERLTARRRH